MPESFRPPSWSAPPPHGAWLEVRRSGAASSHATVRLDSGAHAVFGRAGADGPPPGSEAAACIVTVDDAAASRLHAALCWHENGGLYLIELAASRGTFVDSAKAERHRPLRVRPGAVLRFGEGAALSYTLRVEGHLASGGGGGGGGTSGAVAPEEAAGSKRGREEAASAGPSSVRASHILVKHAGSRRPSSHREAVVTRFRDDAAALLRHLLADLRPGDGGGGGAAFAALAERESHCSSYARGGDLGTFGRGKMQKPFELAAFALAVGEVSDVVDTDSGCHLILRTG